MSDLKEIYDKTVREDKQFILTNEMINVGIKKINKTIQSMEDLVMVHLTNHCPHNTIKTIAESNLVSFDEMKIGEKEYKIPYKVYRNSVHFCLNGAVESHSYGNWDNKRYAILMPLIDAKDKIVAGTECDLFSKGGVPISNNTYILCPEDEIAIMKEENPNAHIIGYQGNNVRPYVNIFLSNILGYKYKEPTQMSRNWNNGFGIEAENAVNLIKSNGWEYTNHTDSKWDKYDKFHMRFEKFINSLKIIIDEKILYSLNNIEDVKLAIDSALKSAMAFTDDDEYAFLNIICNTVKKEFGFDLSKIERNEKIPLFADEKYRLKLVDLIVNELRIRALKEKEQTERLTVDEKFELHYYNDFKEFFNFTPDNRKMLIELEKLYSKPINELSNEELNIVLNATNFILQNGNKLFKDSQCGFAVKCDKITQEELDEYGEVDLNYKCFKPIKDSSLQLFVNNYVLTYSKIIGIDKNTLYNILDKDVNEYTEYESNLLNNLFEALSLHFVYGSCTDFDSSNCKTVGEFVTSVMKYAECFSKYVSGQKIMFDSFGNEVQYDRTMEHKNVDTVGEHIKF